MCRLHLIRHTETEWNKEKRYQGSQDIPLNATGRIQANEIAKLLKNQRFNAMYCSSLKRAFETAQIINQNRNLPIHVLPGLREANYGELENKIIEDAHKEYAESFRKFLSLSAKQKLQYKTVPSQESGQEVLARVLPVLESIALKHIDEDVLIVTHGAVMRYLLISLADYDWEQSKIENGQLIVFSYSKGKFIRFAAEKDYPNQD